MKDLTIGRAASCDLVLEHPTVSRRHARMHLGDDGYVWISDAGSGNGTYLNRNRHWVRISEATLCVGDRVRFGDCEVPIERLSAQFAGAEVSLRAPRFASMLLRKDGKLPAGTAQPEPVLVKPRRNPATGKVEEDQT